MDANSSPTNFLTLKNFLRRNPAVNPRTFSRWKKQDLIDYLQPGGPNTQILVPEDALDRMQQRRSDLVQAKNDPKSQPDVRAKGVRQPDWKIKTKRNPTRKDNDAKED